MMIAQRMWFNAPEWKLLLLLLAPLTIIIAVSDGQQWFVASPFLVRVWLALSLRCERGHCAIVNIEFLYIYDPYRSISTLNSVRKMVQCIIDLKYIIINLRYVIADFTINHDLVTTSP